MKPPERDFNEGVMTIVCVSNQEAFFGVLAEDVAANQEAQNIIHQTMDSLCPAEGSTGTSVRPTNSWI